MPHIHTVRISTDLLSQWLQEGNTVPALYVERGLPPDAKIIGATCRFDDNTVELSYSSETAPETLGQPTNVVVRNLPAQPAAETGASYRG